MSGLSSWLPSDLKSFSVSCEIAQERLMALAEGAEPTLLELRHIARALKVTVSDLACAPNESSTENLSMLFRGASGTPSAAQDQDLFLLSSRVVGANRFSALSEGTVRPVLTSHHEDTYEYAESLAQSFRKTFFDDDQVGPLLSLPQLVEDRLGVLLFQVDLRGIDGAAAIFDRRPYVFVGRRFPPRMLFTLGHELAHLLVHLDWNSESVWVDADIESAVSTDKKEVFANAFASCLLLPPGGVGMTLKKVREVVGSNSDAVGDVEILYLSRIFGVSFLAAGLRCEALKLLPSGGAFALQQSLAKEYGSPEKRAASLGLPERPEILFPDVPQMLMDDAIERVRSGEVSAGRASSDLGVPVGSLFEANSEVVH